MKSRTSLVAVTNLLVGFTSVLCRPQNSFSTNSFSNFDPSSQTFTAGTSTNLHQESFTNNADDFLLSFEQLFPQTNLDDAFNIFSSNGECDEFCQNVLALDAQSQARFEQDLTEFQAQFGQSLPTSPPFSGTGTGAQTPPKNPPRIQTQSSSLIPGQRDNALKTDESFKSNNNKNKQNKNFLFFGNNQKTNKSRPTPTTSRPEPSTTTTPFTVFTTKKTTTNRPTPPPSPRTTSTVSAPINTTTKKSTKIKWTFNGKTIGTSTIPQNSPGKSENGEDNETIPISTFFNEIEQEAAEDERKEAKREEKSQNFPVFDAVPF